MVRIETLKAGDEVTREIGGRRQRVNVDAVYYDRNRGRRAAVINGTVYYQGDIDRVNVRRSSTVRQSSHSKLKTAAKMRPRGRSRSRRRR